TACEAGHAVACADLATMHGRGDGVPRDEAKARGLMQRACDLGLPVACARSKAMP
ncbi:MAG: SEL1-like repeat protein, partial [Myxococcales bacterium]|nr:SEL1-like repeat protein [Myxococcales bacterium]